MFLQDCSLLNGGKVRSKVDMAIERIKTFAPKDGKPYILCFSGGKDSVCVYHLMRQANVKFEAYYCPTSCDPPELIQMIKKSYKDVKILPYAKDENGKPITMWYLIEKKLMPPTSKCRYCCDYLKEERVGGVGDHVVVGIRACESTSRSKQSMVNNWNGKIMIRPIFDWDDNDVWTFIRQQNITYCCLYDQGFKRLGCLSAVPRILKLKEESLNDTLKTNKHILEPLIA